MSITSPRRIIATSPSDITTIGIRVAKEQFMEVCKETERIMKEKAPHPINSVNASGRPGGKGSMATGKTKRSITIEKDGEYYVLKIKRQGICSLFEQIPSFHNAL